MVRGFLVRYLVGFVAALLLAALVALVVMGAVPAAFERLGAL